MWKSRKSSSLRAALGGNFPAFSNSAMYFSLSGLYAASQNSSLAIHGSVPEMKHYQTTPFGLFTKL